MIRLLLALLLVCSPLSAEQYMLSICAIFQDEADYIEEWVAYHHRKGVEHFWLYNNNSTDNYQQALQPWVDAGIVEIIEWPHAPEDNDWKNFSFTIQTGAYNDGLKRAKGCTKWLAIIDTDEFLVPDGPSIPRVLEKHFKYASAVYVNWVMYGTSNVEKAPIGKMLECLTMRAPLDFDMNYMCKSIVKPKYVKTCPNPHYCDLRKGIMLNGSGKPTGPFDKNMAIKHLRIHHFWCRDKDFMYNHKIPRYIRWGADSSQVIERESHMNSEYDPTPL